MTDDRIDRLVREADPYDSATASDLRGACGALLEEIMTTAPQARDEVEGRHRWRRPLVAGLVAASVLAVAIAVPPLLGGSGSRSGSGESGQIVQAGGGTDTIVYTAAAVEVAKSNPRLLIDEPGWAATTVYGFAKDSGTIAFSKGDQEIEMNWYPADSYDGYYKDRIDVGKPEPITVAGQAGVVFRYTEQDLEVMLPPVGSAFAMIRSNSGFADKDEVLAEFAKIKSVAVNTWLAALPPEIVTPGKADEVVDEILADVPVPPGFNRSTVADLGVNSRYYLGAAVIDRVVCGWLGEWQRGLEIDDRAAVTAARTALETAHGWTILDELEKGGGYSEGPWQVAERARAGEGPRILDEMMGCSAQGLI